MLGFLWVAAITPGPNNMLLTASGANFGFLRTFPLLIGIMIGMQVMLLMVAFGIGSLILLYPSLHLVLKVAGSLYLLWLAWKSWRAGPADPSARGSVRPWNIIRRGFLSNALNPKPVLFLLAFLPQFTNSAWGPVWQQILGLGLIFAFTGTLVTMGYGIVAGYAGHVIGRRLGLINKIAAVMFAGLAIRLVTK